MITYDTKRNSTDTIPRNVDIKAPQRTLIKHGVYLGEEERLKELGLLQ